MVSDMKSCVALLQTSAWRRFIPIVVLAAASVPRTATAASLTLTPSKDTTIYGNGNASLSNGAGQYLFAGSSGEERVLRGLVAFNLEGRIPAGSTINSVTLTLS